MKKTNTTINGTDYYRIYRKVGVKLNKNGVWVPEKKTFYGSSKKEAEEKYEKYMQEHGHMYSPLLDEPLGKVIDKWIETQFKYDNLADSTKALYIGNYKRFFQNSDIASTPLKNVNSLMLQNYYNNCTLKTSNLKAINKLLGNFYRHCDKHSICADITKNLTVPEKDVYENPGTVDEIEVWEDADLRKLIVALSGTKLRFLVVLAANTGARFSELLALTYDDIKDNILTINKQITEVKYGENKGIRVVPTKSKCSNRTIPLSVEVVEELEKHKVRHQAEMMRRHYDTNIIFSTDVGTYSSKSTIRKQLNKIYKEIGVPQHTFHSLRHTFATNLCRAGVPIERTSKLMGHSSIETTQKYYVKVNLEDKQEATDKIVYFSLEKKKSAV